MNTGFATEDFAVYLAKNKKAAKPEPAKPEPAKIKQSKSPPPKKQEPSKSRAKDKNLNAIGKSSAEDCCACVKVLGEYIKEIIKLICCVTTGDYEDPETRFSQLFCQLGDITIRLGQDVFNLLKLVILSVRNFLK